MPKGGATDIHASFMTIHPNGCELILRIQSNNNLKIRHFLVDIPKDILTAKAVVPAPKNEPRKNEIIFDAKGRFVTSDRLTREDPMKGAPPHRTYSIKMEAGYAYDFTQRSKEIDSFLELLDEQGNVVAQDDDDGGDLDARILFRANKSGTYQLRATSIKGEFAGYTLDIVRFKVPQSVPMHAPLKSEQRTNGGCVVTALEFVRSPLSELSATWSNDGRAVITIDADGMLRRIRVPEFIEEKGLDLGKNQTMRLLPMANGVAVQSLSTGIFWHVDSETLNVRHHFPMPTKFMIFTSMTSTRMISDGIALADRNKSIPFWLDVDLGTKVRTSRACPEGFSLIAVDHTSMYFYARNNQNKLVRFRIYPKTWEIDTVGDFVPTLWPVQPIVLSSDGELVMRPYDAKAFPNDMVTLAPASGVGIIVYRAHDIRKPVFVLDTGTPAGPPASDPKTGNLYVHCPSKGLMVFDRSGTLLRQLDILKGSNPNDFVSHMIVHPKGGKILMFMGKTGSGKALYVELPENLTPNELPKKDPGPPNAKEKAFHFDLKSAERFGLAWHSLRKTGSADRPSAWLAKWH